MKFFSGVLILLFFSSVFYAEGSGSGNTKKTSGIPSFTFFNTNKISTFIYNDGATDNSLSNNSGFEYPKGSRKALVFISGLLWGAKVNGSIRVGGSSFQQGLVPGRILPDGSAEDPNLDHVRIFRVRRDFKDVDRINDLDFSSEINDGQGAKEDIIEQYVKDWNEWPAENGAPFEDINEDGNYDSDIDIPGIPGASQTIWYVANDVNSLFTFSLYGSPPLGIEMQATFWGYNSSGPSENIMFRRYVLINKSQDTFEDMYLSMWMDPDIGDASNDLVGCDTLLNLGYAYNSQFFDNVYGNFVPAVGFKVLQGPLVDGSLDEKGRTFGKELTGKRNLPMTSFHYIFKCCPPSFGDPTIGSYEGGTIDWYNYMQGNLRSGIPFPVPARLGGGSSKFPYSGDPLTGKGWVDGIDVTTEDRRMGVGTGPFVMAPGDSQEVIYAHIAAGGENGISTLTAVNLLKQYAEFSQFLYDGGFAFDKEMSSPVVNIEPSESSIILTWGSDFNEIDLVENFDEGSYKFQGYNVYQLPDPGASLDDAIRIATYDKIDGVGAIIGTFTDPTTGILLNEIQQFGSDSGIKRYIKIDKDRFSDRALVNGKSYYFAVTAYAYSSSASDNINNIESFPKVLSAVPQNNNPGFSFQNSFSDTLAITHINGSSDAKIDLVVVEPSKLSGNTYNIKFLDNSGMLIWEVTDETESKTFFSEQEIKPGENQSIIIDGISIEINNPIGDSTKPGIPLSTNDSYSFATSNPVFDKTQAQRDIDDINIYPNPYYYNVESTGSLKYPDEVTFNHLPKRAIIRVFNIAGQLVKTIEKNSATQFLKWDLFTKWGRRIPSGLYVIYIEMPEIQTRKIIKLGII